MCRWGPANACAVEGRFSKAKPHATACEHAVNTSNEMRCLAQTKNLIKENSKIGLSSNLLVTYPTDTPYSVIPEIIQLFRQTWGLILLELGRGHVALGMSASYCTRGQCCDHPAARSVLLTPGSRRRQMPPCAGATRAAVTLSLSHTHTHHTHIHAHSCFCAELAGIRWTRPEHRPMLAATRTHCPVCFCNQ